MSGALPEKSSPVHEGTVVPPASDEDRLRAEIEQTREHLGATVEQLAARLDVKSRARAKATELTSQLTMRAKSAAAQARKQAAQAGKRAAPVREAAATGAGTARKNPVTLSAAAGVLAALALLVWLLRGKRGRR